MFGDVPALLRKLRSGAGLSQARAAQAAGISQRTLSGYEKGRALPAVDVFGALISACGVTTLRQLADVVEGSGQPDEVREAVVERLRELAPGESADYYRGLADAYARVAEATAKPK